MSKLEKLLRENPNLSREQAITIWNSLTPEQKHQFNLLLQKMEAGKMKIAKVNVDDQEVVQTVVLEDIDPPSKPAAPFYKHFNNPYEKHQRNQK